MVAEALKSLWTRLVTGDGLRKTRFHTYSGACVNWPGLRYLPSSIWSVVLLKVFGYRQQVPWLGYRAARMLDELIRSDWHVLESGSGMSSLFFAGRCGRLVSIESDADWFQRMRAVFTSRAITNVDYRLLSGEEYACLNGVPDQSFDLVVVDGLMRDRVSMAALTKVKPNGYVLLDNSDVPYPEFRSARETLLAVAEPSDVWFFNDFCPFQVQVNESLLVRVRSPRPNQALQLTGVVTSVSGTSSSLGSPNGATGSRPETDRNRMRADEVDIAYSHLGHLEKLDIWPHVLWAAPGLDPLP